MNPDILLEKLLKLENNPNDTTVLNELNIPYDVNFLERKSNDFMKKLFFVNPLVNLPASWIASNVISGTTVIDQIHKKLLIKLLIQCLKNNLLTIESVLYYLEKAYTSNEDIKDIILELKKLTGESL